MTAPITMHGEWEENFDDPSHPIPSLSALDVEVLKIGGGADLSIIIASPLRADERSQHRLLDKIEIYLRYLNSLSFEEKAGKPTVHNASIIIRLHPESDTLIFDLIERCKPRVSNANATLLVELLDQHYH
jgi:hypothetical protein